MSTGAHIAWDRKVKASAEFAEQLEMFRKPIFRELAPGVFAPTAGKDAEVPEVILCRVVPLGNGEYKLEPFREDWLRLDRSGLRMLGLENRSAP